MNPSNSYRCSRKVVLNYKVNTDKFQILLRRKQVQGRNYNAYLKLRKTLKVLKVLIFQDPKNNISNC